jgi:hypothetical protein
VAASPLIQPASAGVASDATIHWIAKFIWGIADAVLRDLYVRGKYRDVILPMTVLRRLDSLLEPTKAAVVKMKASLDAAKIVHQDQALRQASGQAFYNTSKFTLRDLKGRSSQQQLKADFEAYLDGFSPNVQDILEKFEFRNQIPRLSKADALGTLIEKLLSPDINLSPNPVLHGDGSLKHPGLDNHEDASPVIKKIHKPGKVAADPLHGLFEEGGVDAFLRREVLPYAKDAWFDAASVRTGYEISFTRYFYKPTPLRTLTEIRADIVALEKETAGLLGEIIGGP